MTGKNILVVRLTSMGDAVHTMPAVTDLHNHMPDAKIDWAVDQSFTDIPFMHAHVNNVIPISLRKFKKNLFKNLITLNYDIGLSVLKKVKYDYIIDAQGLLKSALVAKFAQGPKYGYDRESANEQAASFLYDHKFSVPVKTPEIDRIRTLFSKAFEYEVDLCTRDFAFNKNALKRASNIGVTGDKYLVFLHATSLEEKKLPFAVWDGIMNRSQAAGYKVYLPWGTEREKLEADFIAGEYPHAIVLPKLSIMEIAGILAHASGVISVDTGLGHIAAALGNIPTITLYGPKHPELLHIGSAKSKFLLAENGMMSMFNAAEVFAQLQILMKK